MLRYHYFDGFLPNIFFLSAIMLLVQGCQKLPVFSSQPVKETGSLPRMAVLPLTDSLTKNKKEHYTFSTAYDKEYLYVFLRVPDRSLQAKIMVTGMTLWIDTSGHKKHSMGIQYPLKRERRKGGRSVPAEQTGRTRHPSPMYHGSPGRLMKLTGFSGKGSEKMIPANRHRGIAGHIAYYDGNIWSYVVRIPLDSLHCDWKNQPVTLGIVTGSIKQPPAGAGRPGMRSGGMAPRQGMLQRRHDMPGGVRGGRPITPEQMERRKEMMQEMTYPTKFWVKVMVKK